MELNLSNSQIAQKLELAPDSAQDMATQLCQGILAKQPTVVLSGEVECDEVYVVAGHSSLLKKCGTTPVNGKNHSSNP